MRSRVTKAAYLFAIGLAMLGWTWLIIFGISRVLDL